MSSKIQGYVWDACAVSGIKGTRLMVMVRLADYSSDEGTCYPGVKTISRQIGAGESTIRTALSELEAEGWLRRENRRNGNRNTSNMYHLNVEKLEEIALQQRTLIRLERIKNNRFDPPESDASDFEQSESDASEMRGSSVLDPSESGKNNRFDPPESGGHDPQGIKPDPQVKDHEPQEARAKRQKKTSFDPARLKPENVSDEVWQDWAKYRRETRKPLTETTCAYQAKQLAGHQNADEVIRRSIAGGWQGLFPERVPNQPPAPEVTSTSAGNGAGNTWYTQSNDGSAEVFINQAAIDRLKRGANRP
ncbi:MULTISPECIES: helix-turn-helix domain-containing protein [Klebsiella pneumoniae complex]|uniref:helix-turn-helix domain-containing protein n=1 Tax=Klebsiella pneumoniae complex TaxID=3390273 RepID=UPI00190A3004|nr:MULTISPECIES: helix-turn-helix domain-containing protein [Klebsiella]HDS3773932.1 helix-turn-helix domain-containing protein [Enterobacter roggenkampii]MBK2370561.1 helix-turn-helix domain-containing protein [Klebsiella quasivariicola]MBZ6657827.1 helix-turn-helix domain-containing protein [Klebsiella pneumoniae]MCE0136635.1 helix-turn-helix domain-containing protein [Klebsiella pneumoniae]MCJ4380668.1 helix-turn-helix domain-containing protein [Klebsiella pneumoniae]